MNQRPRIPGRRLLHSPGPTPVPDEVLHAMLRQPTDLADPQVMRTIHACEAGMQQLLQTERAEVLFFAGNGHGGWEAVIANLVAAGTKVLVPGTGHFSDGWAEQVQAFGGTALRTPWAEGQPIDPAAALLLGLGTPPRRASVPEVLRHDSHCPHGWPRGGARPHRSRRPGQRAGAPLAAGAGGAGSRGMLGRRRCAETVREEPRRAL